MFRRVSLEASALVGLTLAQVALAGLYAGRLPAQVASHFGLSGAADAWTSREAFLIGMPSMALFMCAIFLFSARMSGWMREEWINLPNKAFWLAPERRENSLRRIERHVLRIGVAVQALLLLVFWQVLSVNAAGSNHLGDAVRWFLLGFFLVFGALMTNMIFDFARRREV